MWTDRGREGKREMGTDRLKGIGRGGGREGKGERWQTDRERERER